MIAWLGLVIAILALLLAIVGGLPVWGAIYHARKTPHA
jgi:hypothetical protein